jgi:hypothetical protein
LVGVAVKVTDVPAHIVLPTADEPIDTLTGWLLFTVTEVDPVRSAATEEQLASVSDVIV